MTTNANTSLKTKYLNLTNKLPKMTQSQNGQSSSSGLNIGSLFAGLTGSDTNSSWVKGVDGAGQGALTGATVGSVVPGIGTGIGAAIGALLGGGGGLFS